MKKITCICKVPNGFMDSGVSKDTIYIDDRVDIKDCIREHYRQTEVTKYAIIDITDIDKNEINLNSWMLAVYGPK